jgi:hypothetical protein
MLTMVTIDSIQSGVLPLPLMDSSAGYIVKEIGGLDPVKATLVSSSRAQTDGAELHNKKREPRNITMRLGLDPDYVTNDVAILRSNLYRYLMPKSTIVFGIYDNDILFGTTEAVVEDFVASMFTPDPEINISLMCYDPDFYAPAEVLINGNTVSDMTTMAVSYPGTTDTGILFSIDFPANIGGVWINNTRPDGDTDTMEIQGTFLAGDTLTVNTNNGKKSVIMTRAGIDTPVLYWLSKESNWILIKNGVNLVRVYAVGPPIPYTLQYTAKYGGF